MVFPSSVSHSANYQTWGGEFKNLWFTTHQSETQVKIWICNWHLKWVSSLVRLNLQLMESDIVSREIVSELNWLVGHSAGVCREMENCLVWERTLHTWSTKVFSEHWRKEENEKSLPLYLYTQVIFSDSAFEGTPTKIRDI